MSFLGALKAAGKTALRSNKPINGFEAGKRFEALESAYDKMGGLKGMLTRDAGGWSETKKRALGMINKNGSVVSNKEAMEKAKDLSWGKVAKSAFMDSEGGVDLAAVGTAYVGANMAVNGNMGIPFISSK